MSLGHQRRPRTAHADGALVVRALVARWEVPMGMDVFYAEGHGANVAQAFRAARQEALREYGEPGYTGSIAEKEGYVILRVPDGRDPYFYAEELLEAGDPRVSGKWGPAGAVDLGDGRWLFFGVASC